MLTKYSNRGKYFFTEPETGKVLFRDKMAERSIKRSYQFKRMQKRLTKKKPPQDNFYDFFDLPKKAIIGESATDNAGKQWTYTRNGWETDAYDTYGVIFTVDEKLPKGSFGDTYTAHNQIEYVYGEHGWEANIPQQLYQQENQLEVVVAHRSKQSWFDLSNKSLFSNYKWNWFEDRVSGNPLMGPQHSSSIDLGNKRGKNSVVGDPIQGDDLVPGGGGGKIKFMKHLPNRLSYFLKSLREVTGAVGQYESIKSIFDSENTEREIDSITRDSIFQNEQISVKARQLHHWGLPYAWRNDSIPYIFDEEFFVKRKDSLKFIMFKNKTADSLRKKHGL